MTLEEVTVYRGILEDYDLGLYSRADVLTHFIGRGWITLTGKQLEDFDAKLLVLNHISDAMNEMIELDDPKAWEYVQAAYTKADAEYFDLLLEKEIERIEKTL